jgi:MoxR-like ATPase
MKKAFIPKAQDIIGYEEELATLNYAIKKKIPTLLIGETGVGKTSLIRHLAFTRKKGLRRLNLNGQTTIDEFVGKILLNKEGTFWQDGILTDAMRKGYWLVLDEINAALPEILFVLHSLLDDDRYIVLSENNGEIVKPHQGFRIFATMNPSGRYAGTKELNKALLSRFPIIMEIDFPGSEEELNIIEHYAPIKKTDIEYLVKMANQLRTAYKKEEIEFILSTRDLINCAIIAQDLGIQEAVRLTVYNRCQSEDRKSVETIINLFFGKGVVRVGKEEKNKAMEEMIKVMGRGMDDAKAIGDTLLDMHRVISHEKQRFHPANIPPGMDSKSMLSQGYVFIDSVDKRITEISRRFEIQYTEAREKVDKLKKQSIKVAVEKKKRGHKTIEEDEADIEDSPF